MQFQKTISVGAEPQADNGEPVATPHPNAPITSTDLAFLSGIASTGTLKGAMRNARLQPSILGAQRYQQRLKSQFGATLIKRNGNGVQLTRAGAYVLRCGQRYRHNLNEVVGRVAGGLDTTATDQSTLRTLRMAMDVGDWDDFVDDAARYLPRVLPAIVHATPELSMDLFTRYQVDAFYSWAPVTLSDRLARPSATYSVVEEPMWVGLSREHPAACQQAVRLRDLQSDHWIVGPGQTAWASLRVACREAGFEPLIDRVAKSDSVVRSLLWRNHGSIAVVSPMSRQPEDNTPFVMLPLVDGPHRKRVLIVDPALVPDHLARLLRHHLRTNYSKRAELRNPAYAAYLDPGRADEPHRTQVREPTLASTLLEPAVRLSERVGPAIEPEDAAMLRVIDALGSLNRAASALMISQPALTRRLKRVERELGFILFVRGYQGTTHTAAGHTVLDGVTKADLEFQAAVRRLVPRSHHRSFE